MEALSTGLFDSAATRFPGEVARDDALGGEGTRLCAAGDFAGENIMLCGAGDLACCGTGDFAIIDLLLIEGYASSASVWGCDLLGDGDGDGVPDSTASRSPFRLLPTLDPVGIDGG